MVERFKPLAVRQSEPGDALGSKLNLDALGMQLPNPRGVQAGREQCAVASGVEKIAILCPREQIFGTARRTDTLRGRMCECAAPGRKCRQEKRLELLDPLLRKIMVEQHPIDDRQRKVVALDP